MAPTGSTPCPSAASRVRRLPYQRDGAAAFARLRHLPWAQWLDGGGRGLEVMAARPRLTLVSRGGISEIAGPEGVSRSDEDPLALLRRLLGPRRPSLARLPFCGGALGYFSYDYGRRLQGLPAAGEWPEVAVGIYDSAVVTDHRRQCSWLVGDDEGLADRLAHGPEADESVSHTHGPVHEEPGLSAYRELFARVRGYIRDGDCYQINLARRLTAAWEGDPWLLYRELRRLSPVPFGAYLSLPFGQVLSLSPERFLQLSGDVVETRPIKGTRPRSTDPRLDAALAAELSRSAKDRAENVMIVDLLRNDLGRVCAVGTVEVPALWQVESFSQVHHLVSTVRGRLAPGRDALDLLQACLPGGSITGAPKRRAMEIIDELEPGPRGVYCGSIGYLSFDGSMDSSIAIRTAVCADGELSYWAGGGVVADSDCQAEFCETEDKAAFFRSALEAFRR